MKNKYIVIMNLCLSISLFAEIEEKKENTLLKFKALKENGKKGSIDATLRHAFEQYNITTGLRYKTNEYEYSEDSISEQEGDIKNTNIKTEDFSAKLFYSKDLIENSSLNIGAKYSYYTLEKKQVDNYVESGKNYRLDHDIALKVNKYGIFGGLTYDNSYIHANLTYTYNPKTDITFSQETHRKPQIIEGGTTLSRDISFDPSYGINGKILFYTSNSPWVPFDIKLKLSKENTPYSYPLKVFNSKNNGYSEIAIDYKEITYLYGVELLYKIGDNVHLTTGYERTEIEIKSKNNSQDIEPQNKAQVGLKWSF